MCRGMICRQIEGSMIELRILIHALWRHIRSVATMCAPVEVLDVQCSRNFQVRAHCLNCVPEGRAKHLKRLGNLQLSIWFSQPACLPATGGARWCTQDEPVKKHIPCASGSGTPPSPPLGKQCSHWGSLHKLCAKNHGANLKYLKIHTKKF
jgi:hypothetical protein